MKKNIFYVNIISDRPNTSSISLKQDSSYNSSNNYTTTIKEKSERYVSTSEKESDYASRFRPIEKDATGARAINVQDIPDGVLGRPVEFESNLDWSLQSSI